LKKKAPKNVAYDKKLHAGIIATLVSEGKSDTEILKVIGISKTTYQRWKKKEEIAKIYEENDAFKNSKYDPTTHVPAVEYFKIMRKTDEEIAEQFKIHISTLYRWIKEYPDFADAYSQTKLIANASALKELRDRGLTKQTIRKTKKVYKYFYVKDEKTAVVSTLERLVEKTEQEEDVLPDLNALKFFIQHNDSDHFTEKGRAKEEERTETRSKVLTVYEEKAMAVLDSQDASVLRMVDDIFKSLTIEEQADYMYKNDLTKMIDLISKKLEEADNAE